MSENCNHDCAGCDASCSERSGAESFLASQNPFSNIKKVIGVVSGKGGVGKSLVTSLLAVSLNRAGYKTAILDADITGPSIPKMFGVHTKALGSENGIIPAKSSLDIKIMSINLLLEDETQPVIWRGPILANAVKQFYTDVVWDEVDYMLVDMPPGTGDVVLTVFQSLPVDGIVVVSSPQELVGMIVEKAVNMAETMNKKVIGLVENMSYFECPDCHTIHEIFGKSNVDAIAKKLGIDSVAKIPVDAKLASASDKGCIELFEGNWLDPVVEKILIN